MIAKLNFHSVDEPPERDGRYFAICVTGVTFSSLNYSKKLNMWNVANDNVDTAMEIAYWAELPLELKELCLNAEVEYIRKMKTKRLLEEEKDNVRKP